MEAGIKRAWQRARLAYLKGTGRETEPLLKSRAEGSRSTLLDEENLPKKDAPAKAEPPPSLREVLNSQTGLNLVAYTLLAMHSIGYDQLLPVFLHHPKTDLDDPSTQLPFKFKSGFSATNAEIGAMFTLYGLMNIFFQLAIFPPVAQKYGVLNCLRVCAIAYPIIFFLTPFPALLPGNSRFVVLFALWLCKGLAGSFAFPCSTILLTNSASSLRVLGTLNGIATSISAVGRALGPTIGGNAFSLGVKHGYVIFPFFLMGIITALSAIPVFFLVEGEGFGGDDFPIDEDDSDVSDGELEIEDQDLLNQSMPPSLIRGGAETPDDVESREESEYGGLGQMVGASSRDLERTWSAVSSATAETMEDDGDNASSQLHRYRTADSIGPQDQDSSARPQRPGLRQQGSRRLRRRSSAPLGMGPGFRRMSTNLGQTRSGFGDGNSFAGGVQ